MEPRSSRKHVIFLIVEAGETGLSTRKMVLETAGYNVVSALSAADGLHFLETLPISAVLFDPGVDDIPPLDFMAKAKRCRPSTPIYVLANQPWVPDELKSYTEGVFIRMHDPSEMVQALVQKFDRKP